MNCTVENCGKPLHSRKLGLCATHYQKYLRYGTATPTPEMKAKPGPKPDPTKPRSRHNPDNPSRSRPKKPKVERTHCKNGHEFTPENTSVVDGRRVCKTCRNNAAERSRKKAISEGRTSYGNTGVGRGTPQRERGLAKTHCPQGHLLDDDNTKVYKGYRYCKTCNYRYQKNHYEAKGRYQKYGITKEQFEEMLDRQGGHCAICPDPMTSPKNQHIDHDHVTGQVRGVLCRRCNLGIGKFEDNPELLINAAQYLMDSWRLSTDSPQPQPQD